MKAITILILLAALALAGCSPVAVDPPPTSGIQLVQRGAGGSIYFYHDEARGVGVWVYDGFRAGGVAVLPDSEYQH